MLKIGGRYNWPNQAERLIFIGRNFSGNGYWNQFEKVDEPGKVWCEILDSDLHMLKETKMKYKITLGDFSEDIFYEMEKLSEEKHAHECIITGKSLEDAASNLAIKLVPFLINHLEKH